MTLQIIRIIPLKSVFLIGIPTSICSTFSSRGVINSSTFVFYMEYTLIEGKKLFTSSLPFVIILPSHILYVTQ